MLLPTSSNENTSLKMVEHQSISNAHEEDLLTEVIPRSKKKGSITNASSISSKWKWKTIENEKPRVRMSRRPVHSIELTTADMSRRLSIRKRLSNQLAILSDTMSVLALLGIVLMIIANELTFDRVDHQDTKISWWCKSIITTTTVILLALLVYYQSLDLKLYSNENSLQSRRIGLTSGRLCLIAMEFIVCAVHPIPRWYPYSDPPKLVDINGTDITPYPLSHIPIDVALGLPMFLRLYLIGRSIYYHSHLVRNASLRSFGYLNRVSIDFNFLTKTGLEQWPGRCLGIFCLIAFLIGSWSIRASSYTSANQHLSMLDAMWFFIVTYTTIGYGDITPTTRCGRCIAAIIGFIGLLSSALFIAVLTQKLHLARREKYVHTFVLNTALANQRQYHAANVIKNAIRIWMLKRKRRTKSFHFLQIQRKLYRSIADLQTIKQTQRNLIDSCVGFHELMAAQQDLHNRCDKLMEQMIEIKSDGRKMEEKFKTIAGTMSNLQSSMNILLDKINK